MAAGADVAHAGGDGADQVLAPVVHLSGAKENLFQGAGRADFDARSARQICMRCGHAPMVAAPRRFVRFRESAADHDGVRAAREGFANIAAFAHAAVGDDRDVTRGFLEIGVARRGAINRGRHLRHTEAENAARGAGRSGPDADEHRRGTAFHDFQRDVVSDGVPDDDGNAHLPAEFCEVERFIFRRKRDGPWRRCFARRKRPPRFPARSLRIPRPVAEWN